MFPEGRKALLREDGARARGLDTDDGVDVFEAADAMHVSTATLDADLARVRGLLGGTELTLERSASRAWLRGTEMAQRRLPSKLAHDEMDAGSFDLEALRRTLGEGSVGASAFGPFKTELVAELGTLGYFVNEFGISDVVMHIAIAADRVASHRGLERTAGEVRPAQQEVTAILERLVERHLGVTLGAGDLQHLSTLVLTRVVAPGASAPSDHARSRNPLTKSLKSTYPMIFEVAVFIASGLQERLESLSRTTRSPTSRCTSAGAWSAAGAWPGCATSSSGTSCGPPSCADWMPTAARRRLSPASRPGQRVGAQLHRDRIASHRSNVVDAVRHRCLTRDRPAARGRHRSAR